MVILETSPPNGVDPTTFWLLATTLGGVISTLAGIIYHSERERRKAAEDKLAKYEEVAPDVVLEVRRLTSVVRGLHPEVFDEEDTGIYPYPYKDIPRRRRTRR